MVASLRSVSRSVNEDTCTVKENKRTTYDDLVGTQIIQGQLYLGPWLGSHNREDDEVFATRGCRAVVSVTDWITGDTRLPTEALTQVTTTDGKARSCVLW